MGKSSVVYQVKAALQRLFTPGESRQQLKEAGRADPARRFAGSRLRR